MHDQPSCTKRAAADRHAGWPIVSGPDTWMLLMSFTAPDGEDGRQRCVTFIIQRDSRTLSLPIRLFQLARRDSSGTAMTFCGAMDRPPDPTSYDQDGVYRRVRGWYNTRSKTGAVEFV